MKIAVFIQARMSSTRLPGKVLMDLGGMSVLELMIGRLTRSRKVDQIVVLTSDQESDDAIESFCRNKNINCFRGSLEDVLDRFYQAALIYKPDHIVRLTADCPFIDPEVLDTVLEKHLESGSEYSSNCRPPTYPDGLDVEVFTVDRLIEAWKLAKESREREHVTPYIFRNSRMTNIEYSQNLSKERWTLDNQEDFEFLKQVFLELPDPVSAGFKDILEMVKLKSFRNENRNCRNYGSK